MVRVKDKPEIQVPITASLRRWYNRRDAKGYLHYKNTQKNKRFAWVKNLARKNRWTG